MNIATSVRLPQARYLAYAMTAVILTAIGFFLFTSSALAAAPTMTAVTADTDSDGTVDQITITFSEATKIVSTPGTGLSSLVLSSGCTIPSGTYATASTTTLVLGSLTGCTAGNTAILPTLSYTQVALCSTEDAICDAAAANQMATGTPNATSTDGAKPAILIAATSDNNSDGTVDRLNMTFSELVTITDGGTDNDITLAASSGTATVTAGSYGAVGVTTLTYVISVSATGNTAITIAPTYATAGAGSISDTVNEMANAETVAGTDGAKPAVLIASTNDTDADGTVDQLDLTFSESVTVTDGGTDNDFTLVASTGTATIVASTYGTSGTTLSYVVLPSATGNTAITIAPTYATVGTGSIIDANTNEMLNGETVAGTDGAKPAVLIAATNDNDSNGTVDQLVLTFSESVTVTDGGTDDDFSLVASSGTATIVAGTYGTVGSTVTYTVLPSVTSNTAITISPTYATAGAGDVTDANSNQMANGETVAGTDGAKPAVLSSVTGDNGANGSVDRLVLTFSESVTVTDGGADTDFTLVASTGTVAIVAGVYGVTAATLTYTILPSTTLDTSISVTPTYATAGAGDVTDANSNQMANGETVAGTDGVAPVVVSVSPTSGATGVNRDANVVITFSEAMDSTFAEGGEFTVSPNPSGTQSGVFDGPTGTIATIALPTLNCGATYTVTTAQGSIDASAGTPTGLLTTGPSTGDWSFTTVGCGSTGGGGGSSATITRSVIVNAPNGGETYHSGDLITISWTGSNVGTVNVSYATSASGAYTSIASNMNGTGSYAWTVPDVSTTDAFVKVEGYDASTLLASDTSNAAFTIVGTTALKPQPPLSSQPTVGTGISPLTGLPEAINAVASGDVLRGEHYPTVYWIDGDLHRRPFQDAQTYFTYYSSWNNVRTVTDATLATLTMGKPMLPKAGVVLVKIVSDPRVYALQTDGSGATLLRWIPSEAVAITLYGNAWADYVIDVPSTSYTQFGHGADMTSSVTVDRTIMKTRMYLNQ